MFFQIEFYWISFNWRCSLKLKRQKYSAQHSFNQTKGVIVAEINFSGWETTKTGKLWDGYDKDFSFREKLSRLAFF